MKRTGNISTGVKDSEDVLTQRWRLHESVDVIPLLCSGFLYKNWNGELTGLGFGFTLSWTHKAEIFTGCNLNSTPWLQETPVGTRRCYLFFSKLWLSVTSFNVHLLINEWTERQKALLSLNSRWWHWHGNLSFWCCTIKEENSKIRKEYLNEEVTKSLKEHQQQ